MFKVGDKVRIIAPFAVGNPEGYEDNLFYAEEMDEFIGKMGKVGSIVDGHISVDTDGDGGWYWLPKSLEHVNTLHVGDVVKTIPGGHVGSVVRKFNQGGDDLWKIFIGWGEFINVRREWVEIMQKYPLRNAKGHYIKCDRYVNPIEAAVKRRKPVAKGVDAAIIKKPAVAPIKTLPEPVKAPPKHVLDIRARLAERAKAGCAGNRCNYSIEFDNGKIRHQAPDACHARLLWNTYCDEDRGAKEIVNIALNITPHYKGLEKADQERYPLFVKYILNDSPWAFCFITKDVDEALEKGILMDVQQNVSHIVGAAMSLRLATEFPATLKPFADALAKGYSGNVAHLVSGHLMGGRVTEWPYHSALTSGLGIKAIAKFFKEGYAEKLPAIAKDKKQTHYRVFGTISPKHPYGDCAKDDTSLMLFTQRCAVSTKNGEGFAAKTVFDYEATLVNMADAFTKELT